MPLLSLPGHMQYVEPYIRANIGPGGARGYSMLAPTATHLTIQTAYPLPVGTTTLVNKTSSDK